MDKEQASAFDELTALLKLGDRLKIITSQHVCGGGDFPYEPGFKKSVCNKFEYDVEDPRHYMISPVWKIEESPHKDGAYIAYSKRGDACVGYPTGLLSTLRKWNR